MQKGRDCLSHVHVMEDSVALDPEFKVVMPEDNTNLETNRLVTLITFQL